MPSARSEPKIILNAGDTLWTQRTFSLFSAIVPMTSQPACQDIIARHSLDILSDTSTSNRGDKKKALASFKKECTEQLETWGDQGVTNVLSDLFDRMSIWAMSDIEYVREQVALLYLQ